MLVALEAILLDRIYSIRLSNVQSIDNINIIYLSDQFQNSDACPDAMIIRRYVILTATVRATTFDIRQTSKRVVGFGYVLYSGQPLETLRIGCLLF
jgi:hypothetical protein